MVMAVVQVGIMAMGVAERSVVMGMGVRAGSRRPLMVMIVMTIIMAVQMGMGPFAVAVIVAMFDPA